MVVQNQWNYSELPEQGLLDAELLSRELGITRAMGELLYRKGYKTVEDAKRFLYPKLSGLLDPFDIRDMSLAVDRLNYAVGHREKILVYGDYDVDGTTAVALVYQALRELGQDASLMDFYIPDRSGEGYGVSFQGVDYALQWGAQLVVVLDCGIKAVEEIAYAKSKGLDFIICDHHLPGEELPPAVAILNPKRAEDSYPFKHLSGCGLGFKLMQAFCRSNGLPEKLLYKYLDLLALAIAADVVPLVGENRVLTYYGLRQLNRNPSIGVKALIETAGLSGEPIGMESIGFKLAPRINASGRMMDGKAAVSLLISRNEAEVQRFSDVLDEYNTQRRELDMLVTQEAIEVIHKIPNYKKRNILVVYAPHWHKGVIGIVASRMAERYRRPVVVLTDSAGEISGSARSTEGFDVYQAIGAVSDLLHSFGGHPYAVGLSMEPEKLPLFIKRIEGYVSEHIDARRQERSFDVDLRLSFQEISPRLMRELSLLAPLGTCNEKPLFLTEGVVDTGYSALVGKEDQHLKLVVRDRSSHNGKWISGIAYSQADQAEKVFSGQPFSLIYTLEDYEYNGRRRLQMLVRDIHVED